MGRKKASSGDGDGVVVPTTAAEATTVVEPTADGDDVKAPKMADVLRECLDACGLDTDTAEAKKWVSQHYPSWEYNPTSFASSLSTMKKKLRGGDGPQTSSVMTPRADRVVQPTVTVDDLLMHLMRVKELVEENSSLEVFANMVQEVGMVAAQCGGFEKLKMYIDALAKLQGK